MEEAFEKFKKQGKNSVDTLVQWMTDSKIVDNTKDAKDKVSRLFEDAANKQSVELEKFKKALETVAGQQKKSVEEFAKTLVAESERLLAKLAAGAKAGAEAATKELKK